MKKIIMEIRNLSFSYDALQYALKNVSLNIYEQEKIAVLGSNGAGKSTFFLHLNGVKEADIGEILLDGQRIEKKNKKRLRQQVGIVFQDPDSQIIASTVKSEVAFGPLNMKLPRVEVEARTMDAMTQMKLLPFAQRPPHYLSGGEKKRVSIADILAMKTNIVLFDEPTASLDPANQDMVEQLLEELANEGKTILVSTHDVDFAFRFADRILIFHEGEIIADGLPEVVFSQKEQLRIANLKQPMMMQVAALLVNQGYLAADSAFPKSLEDLGGLLMR